MPANNLSPAQRREVSRIANATRWAQLTRAERAAATAPARRALLTPYLDGLQPDPDITDPAEQEADLLRRAQLLRSADLARARRRKGAQR
jgi:hypothetical protein